MSRSGRRPAPLFASLAVLLAAVLVPGMAEPAARAGGEVAPRIVGGVEVAPAGKYPFVVALVHASQEDEHTGQYCGGALIAPEWVLTAGHCIPGAAADVDVVVGRHDVGDDTQGERLRATAVYRHPDYDAGTLANDVGLIRLAAPATAGSPIALATAADAALFAPGVEATVVGWGETLGLPPGTPNEPAELREVRLPIISDQDCAAAYGGGFILPDMLCAGNLQAGGVDACYGDSGGPLFVAASSGYLQVGSVSGGFGCAEPGRPGLYARTATYQAWIISVISGAPPPEPPPVSGVMCRGRRANIVGTRGDDQLRGTDDDDVIAALGGDDVVWGLGGDDLICLGPGNDRAYGNAGDDIVRGAGGDDYVEGNLGADRLIGGAGVDTLIGGEGPDVVQGGGGGDIIHGLAGDDLLRGGPGDDALAGGPGSDVLYGGAGRDVLRGGEDRDTCYTGEDVVCESVAGPGPG